MDPKHQALIDSLDPEDQALVAGLEPEVLEEFLKNRARKKAVVVESGSTGTLLIAAWVCILCVAAWYWIAG